MTYNLKWLTDKFDNGDTIKYVFFWGHSNKDNQEVGKFVFSQWFYSPFIVDGVTYKTTEHWMMAHKALLFEDKNAFERIIAAEKPGEVKEIGRQIKAFDEIKWNDAKFEIVKTGNIHKFNQHPKLKEYLLSTGDRVLVEASPTDAIWGIGLSHDEKLIENPYTWRGTNLLGFILMEVRAFLSDFGSFDYITAQITPPWKHYPKINPHDLFWRMGAGEQYTIDFWNYYSSLSEREQLIFQLSYPVTGDWSDSYD
jgi:ribA/ribD-fused uncharacterized protein